MKKIKHIIFWLIVIGLILLLFSSHVMARLDTESQDIKSARSEGKSLSIEKDPGYCSPDNNVNL